VDSISTSIIVGVISGILTSALIFLAVSIFNSILIPWYQAIIYRGVNISGEWIKEQTNSIQKANFIFEQKAHKIKGLATFFVEDAPAEEIRTFVVDGEISERFVILILKHKDRQRLGVSTFLLEIVSDGRTMQGYSSAYNIYANEIASVECALTRTK
jgi:hypothetical protein